MPQQASHPERRARRAWAVVLVVVLLLLGLAALTYAAWLRGYVSLPSQIEAYLPDELSLPGLGSPGNEAPAAIDVPPQPTTAELLLDELEGLPPRGARQVKNAVEQLAAVSRALDLVARQSAPGAADTAAREGQLAALDEAYQPLVDSYNAFEDAAGRPGVSSAEEALAKLREEYLKEFGRFIDLLGRCYIADSNLARPEYARGEQLQQVLGLRGRLDPAQLHERWIAVVSEREQQQLEAKFSTEFEDLAARLATLRQLRRDFNATAQQLPAPNVSRGRLTEGAAAMLELYDAFAFKLEDLWMEWATFQSQLPAEIDRPKRMTSTVQEITDLFYSEHLDCFTQIYRIYALDRELTHPVYERLVGDHYLFVEAEWPARLPEYRAVSAEYERQWDRSYRPQTGDSEDAPPPGVELKGPPGYNP